ncbi:MAG: hypothetical protein PVG65_03420 [Candidatus Thorarchaeota archaeon]|jgi:DnaJ-class molecular chaperone
MNYFECKDCKGHGFIPFKYITDLGDEIQAEAVCESCHGQGKLDWIENIIGKKDDTLRFQQYRSKQ